MAKALRVFVILGLVLSIGALVLGVLLFQQREQLKGRTQKMEETVMAVAQSLTAPREPHIKAIEEKLDGNLLKTYANKVDPNSTMVVPLTQLRKIVENRYEELVNTYADLQAEKDAHAATRAELARTRQDLQDAKQEIAQLNDTLNQTKSELSAARQKIGELEGQISNLESELDSVKKELAAKTEEAQRLNDELLVYKARDNKGDIQDVPQMNGQVILVNPEWNFIIVDLGTENKLKPTVEMIVHRGDRMVGKIKISSVMDRISVAEIQRDWEQLPIQEGDRVFN